MKKISFGIQSIAVSNNLLWANVNQTYETAKLNIKITH